MSNYEGKLGEWLKYVQQQINSAGPEAEKADTGSHAQEKAVQMESSAPERVIVRDRVGQATSEEAAGIDTGSVIANTSVVENRGRRRDDASAIFDDSDVPNVEDFLPMLKDPENRMERRTSKTEVEPPIVNFPIFSEGTGDPKPLIKKAEEPVARKEETVEMKAVVAPVESAPAPQVGKVIVDAETKPAKRTSAKDLRAQWDKMPKHIQVLFGQTPEEVAQNSYKRFTETREDLIARLLDPTLSLEEAARILNVCPTTVRRYTNKGALKHFRTEGNQRRFRLSDVLVFLESTTKH